MNITLLATLDSHAVTPCMSLQAATKAINQKNEETLQATAVKSGAALKIAKPTGVGIVQKDKKGGKTGIAAQLKKLNHK